MKTKYLRVTTILFIGVALAAGSQATTFAADNSWLQSLFGTQSTNGDAQTPTTSGNLSQDQSLVQGAAEAVNRSQQKAAQDSQALQQAYQKLQQDKQAGLDTRADLQAIQAQKQALRGDRTDSVQQTQILRTYQTAVAQDQGQPVPVFNNTSGYTRQDGRTWDHGNQNSGDWRQNSQNHRRDHWTGPYHKYDTDGDGR